MKLTSIITIALFTLSFNSQAMCLFSPTKCDKPKGNQVTAQQSQDTTDEAKKDDDKKKSEVKDRSK